MLPDGSTLLTRRRAIALVGCAALPSGAFAAANEKPLVRVHKDPACGCCTGWVEHLEKAGFGVHVTEAASLGGLKERLGIPADLRSCHTAEVDGYVLEGHVPAAALRQLLDERPLATGLAVPGMPLGSPGMEVEGAKNEPFEVVLFWPAGRRSFGRYVGARAA